jgi:Fe-S-cluster containining protein
VPISLKAKKQVYCSHICHAWCCRNLVMFNDTKKEHDETFFKLRGLGYDTETGAISIPNKCKWITNQNKCRLYSWRPNSCREYECDKIKSLTVDS